MFTYCPYIITVFLLLLFLNNHWYKYVVLGGLPDSSQKHESYQPETCLPDCVQLVHVLHEREDETEGESAVYYDVTLGCDAVYILKHSWCGSTRRWSQYKLSKRRCVLPFDSALQTGMSECSLIPLWGPQISQFSSS
jgi:hypothetical protein